MKGFLLIACLMASASCFSQQFAKYQPKQICSVKGDTVELSEGIRFIKVDGKVYEIRRNTTIQEVEPAGGLFIPFGGHGTITSDTSTLKSWHINSQIGSTILNNRCVPAIHYESPADAMPNSMPHQ